MASTEAPHRSTPRGRVARGAEAFALANVPSAWLNGAADTRQPRSFACASARGGEAGIAAHPASQDYTADPVARNRASGLGINWQH